MSKIKITDDEIEMNGRIYVPKESFQAPAPKVDGLELVLVRTRSGGVHFGYRKENKGNDKTTMTLLRARNIWYWTGAAALNQLACEGVTKPETCKITQEVPWIELTEVLAIYPISEKAAMILNSVKVWKV